MANVDQHMNVIREYNPSIQYQTVFIARISHRLPKQVKVLDQDRHAIVSDMSEEACLPLGKVPPDVRHSPNIYTRTETCQGLRNVETAGVSTYI